MKKSYLACFLSILLLLTGIQAVAQVADTARLGSDDPFYDYEVKVVKTVLPVGIGNLNERLTGFRVTSQAGKERIKSIQIDLTGITKIRNISRLKIYYNGPNERFNPDSAIWFGSRSPHQKQLFIFGDQKLQTGDNWFWVLADISSVASEGNTVCASVLTLKTDIGFSKTIPNVTGSRTLILDHKLLFSGGDEGSKSYRIPAILSTNQKSLITATDKRCTSPEDLPADMDIVIKRSVDNGKTWGKTVVIAGEGTLTGFSAPCLVQNRNNNEIICLIAGKKGFYGSTATDPIRTYLSVSRDDGITWTPVADITRQIYGAECTNPVTQLWQAAWVTSGTAIQLKSGRLMAGLVVREKQSRDISDFVIYSDDNGKTWNVSPGRASTKGNEACLVELDNGNILMSIRTEGIRMFSISKDQGMNWDNPFPQPAIIEPSCNGAIMRYTSVSGGFEKNRLLHSIPWATNRSNNSVLVSFDEGMTWPIRKTIYSGVSAYSSLCVLNDGTIGMYYEVGEYETYQLYFARFTLGWLTNGLDMGIESWKKTTDVITAAMPSHSSYLLYPNPAVDKLNITGDFKPGTLLRIYSGTGSLVEEIKADNQMNQIQIPLTGYQPGIYFIRIGSESMKFIVE